MGKKIFILCMMAVQFFTYTASADNKAVMTVIANQSELTKSLNVFKFSGDLIHRNIKLSFKDNQTDILKTPNTDIEIGTIISNKTMKFFYLSDKSFKVILDKNAISFAGNGSKEQTYLNNFIGIINEMDIISNLKKVLTFSYKEYDQLIQEKKKESQAIISKVGGDDPKLKQWMQTSLDLYTIYNKIYYLTIFENKDLQKRFIKKIKLKNIAQQEIPLSFIKKEKFNLNEKYLGIATDDIELLLSGLFTSIQSLDESKQQEILNHIHITKTFKKSKDPIQLYLNILSNISDTDNYTNLAMMAYMKYGGTDENWKEFLNVVEKHISLENSKILRKQYKKREQRKLQAQNINKLPAGTYVCKDIDGKEVRLSDFKGKYIFLDIWATWCGPCKGELPSLAKQEENFKDKNVVFMSISIDKKENSWSSFVKENKLKGIQVIAGKASQEISKLYSIRMIPRFILLGKDGKVLNGNFMRPSNEKFAQTLNDYINK